MTNQQFRTAVLVSFFGHMAFFSIFGLSFGERLAPKDYAAVSFLGSILRNSDFMHALTRVSPANRASALPLRVKADTSALDKTAEGLLTPELSYLKPMVDLSLYAQKPLSTPVAGSLAAPPQRKESVIMFYPQLPYHFLLYFQDRQQVHIELMFNIISEGGTNSVTVKRKISSGNLEADLLSMRYIGHYLFIQQARFTPNKWQAVKIDLRPRNE